MNVGESASPARADPWIVFRRDLAAYRHAVELKEFGDALVFTNRFASDALLFADQSDSAHLAFIALVLRIACEDMTVVAAVSAAKGAKGETRNQLRGDPGEMIDSLSSVANDTLADPTAEFLSLCRAFYEFEAKVSSHERDKHELDAYGVGFPLGPAPRKRLTDVYVQNRALAKLPQNRVEESLLQEMARLSHVTIFEEKDLCFYTLMRALVLDHEYTLFELNSQSDELRSSAGRWVDEVFGRAQGYLTSLEESSTELAWGELVKLTGSIVLKWRKDWIRYGQLFNQLALQERQNPGDAHRRENTSDRFRDESRPKHD